MTRRVTDEQARRLVDAYYEPIVEIGVGTRINIAHIAADLLDARAEKAEAVAEASDRHALACLNERDSLRADRDLLAAKLVEAGELHLADEQSIRNQQREIDRLAATVARVCAVLHNTPAQNVLVCEVSRALEPVVAAPCPTCGHEG